ncbi:MAG: hypothetical protein AB7K04_03530 [Pseudorhodoplanes sp.]
MSLAEFFHEKAAKYHDRAESAPSAVMRAWYQSLERSYVILAADETRYYNGEPRMPRSEAAPAQPAGLSEQELDTLNELEATLQAHIATRHRGADSADD